MEVKLDSELVTKQINREYKIKEIDTLGRLYLEVHNLIVEFPGIRFVHVPRGENKEADQTDAAKTSNDT